MPFPAGDAEPGDAPGPASQSRSHRWAEGTGAGGSCRTPTSVPEAAYLAPSASDALTRPAAPATRRCGPDAGVPGGERGPHARARYARGGTEPQPRPSGPPLLRAEPSFGAARPIPALRLEAQSINDPFAKEPAPRAVLAYGRPSLLGPTFFPRLPRSRVSFACFGRAGCCEGVLSPGCVEGLSFPACRLNPESRLRSFCAGHAAVSGASPRGLTGGGLTVFYIRIRI